MSTEQKYQKGETVRVTGSTRVRHALAIGDEYLLKEEPDGEVTDVDGEPYHEAWVLQAGGDGLRQWVHPDDFEKVVRAGQEEEPFGGYIDPAAVKAGDTVTLERDRGRLPDQVVAARSMTSGGCSTLILEGGIEVRVTGPDAWTLTAHQPAPEPEPEWEPGTVADIEVGGDMQYRAIRTDDNLWSTDNHWSYEDAEVTDVRPLAVIDPADVSVAALIDAAIESAQGDGYWPDRVVGGHMIRHALSHLGIEASRTHG